MLDGIATKLADLACIESGPVCVISIDALGAKSAGQLRNAFGSRFSALTVRELRSGSLIRNVFDVRSRKIGTLFVLLQSEAETPVAPLMLLFSTVLGARRTYTIWPSLEVTREGFADRVRAVFTVLRSVVSGVLSLIRNRRRIAKLLETPRMEPVVSGDGPATFVKVTPIAGGSFGGALAHFLGVLNGFAQRGIDCIAFTSGNFPTKSDSISYLPPPLPESMTPNLKIIPSAAEMNAFRMNEAYEDYASERLSEDKPKFIYQRLTLNTFCGVELSRRFRVPLIVEYNGSEVWVASNWGTPYVHEKLSRDVEAVCLKHAHLIVCVSTALRDELIETYNVEPRRIVCHPNGVDPEIYNPARFSAADIERIRAECGIKSDEILVSFIGSFGKWHGVDILARAIAKLVENDAAWLKLHRVRFMLIGDGEHRRSVEELLINGQANPFVVLTGAVPQEQAPAYLAAADVFVCSHVANEDGSEFFGSPTKLFEYLAMEKPIVASNLAQIGQVLDGCPHVSEMRDRESDVWCGECGVLAKPGDVADLAEGIRLVVERGEWRRQAGIAARDLALQKYSWQHHVNAIARGLADVIEAH